jgi:hypothetical protein
MYSPLVAAIAAATVAIALRTGFHLPILCVLYCFWCVFYVTFLNIVHNGVPTNSD